MKAILMHFLSVCRCNVSLIILTACSSVSYAEGEAKALPPGTTVAVQTEGVDMSDSEDEPRPDVLVGRAIIKGDLIQLKALFAKYPDEVQRIGVSGNRLYWAVMDSQTDVINYLIDIGVDVNYRGDSTPLELSIRSPNIQIAKLLLKRGADPNIGRPLISALNCDDKSLRVPFLKLLVENGADVNQLYDLYGDRTNLFSALDGEKGDCRDYLLSVGAKSSEELKKEGRKFGEVFDRSGKKIRDTPPPKPKKEPDVIEDEEPDVFASDVVGYFTQEIGTPDPKSLIEIVPGGVPITVHSIPAARCENSAHGP